ncbi:iron ABC transporter permease [Roseomonas frigidaquae]|uniref:Iron ABC transporter permease n=1 Tax=Falsiroseomonas frigidaquae TaxID=487318 RepID=A0ABX1EZX6_9PROT|nr:iron ABC transporter permease [Falsiroseomonas frigidaquae]NKE45639.1 iron ABC transporter permease [Falsiroseomonas frigidaquae]
MGALTLARAALLCATLGLFLAPWHGLQDGISEVTAWPGGSAAPLVALLLDGSRWWLWPVALLLALAAPALLRGRAGAGLAWIGAGLVLAVFGAGYAIGLNGLQWGWLAPLLGAPPAQPSLGWGAFLVLAGGIGLFAAGQAARGRFGADAFVAFLVCSCGFLLLLFVFLPLVNMLSAALYEDGRLAPAAFGARLVAPEAWSLACLSTHAGCGVVWNTLLLATLTAVISTLLGLAFALLAVRGGARGKVSAGAFRAMTILPLITPPFVVSLALIVLFGRTGIVTGFMWDWFDIPRSRWIYGLPGVLLAQVLAQAPIAFLLLDGALRAISPSLEEAASTMGARRMRVFCSVTWPLLKPALAASFLLAFVESLADFGNPLVLGGDFDVLSTRIFFAIAGARHDPGRAAALALLLLAITFGAFALQALWLGKRRYTTVTGKGDSGIPAALPAGLKLTCAAVAWPWMIFTAAVYGIILVGGFVHDIGRGDLSFTWRHLGTGFEVGWFDGPAFIGSAWDSLFTTIQVAAISAPLTAGLGILLAWLIARQNFPGRRGLEFMTMLSFAIPGTVVGVSYIMAFNVPPVELTGTALILVICFVFRNLPVGVRGGIAALAQIDKSLDEASATMGGGAFQTLRRVVLPLLRPAIVTALAYSFVTAMTAVSAVIFLVSARHNLATVYIVGRVEAGEMALAIAYSTVLIVIMLVTVLGIEKLVGRARLGRASAAAPPIRAGA